MGERAKSAGIAVIIVILLGCIVTAVWFLARAREPGETRVLPPPTITPEKVNPWKAAARLVEEDRGEPVGRKAEVEVPPELKHYEDRRRFLAVQVAEWRAQNYDLPHDFAELADLIRRDSLVEMAPYGQDYILYGVGANATDSPFTHYDWASGKEIPLFANLEEYKRDDSVMAASIEQLRLKRAGLQKELKATKRRDREARKRLASQIAENDKAVKEAENVRKAIAGFYNKADRRKTLLAEYRSLADHEDILGGKLYDLGSAEDRGEMKVRLLSFLRPEAKDVLLEIARLYKGKFKRPLPVTSLVRTEQYQLQLSESNSNATKIGAPPHATGLAFDIYYYHMTSSEQQFVMNEIARLKTAGRVEALRELRDHIHVFAFADGKPPDEGLIALSIKQLGAGGVALPAKKASGNRQLSRTRGSLKRARPGQVTASSPRRGKAGNKAGG